MRLHILAKPSSKRPHIKETTDLFVDPNERHFVVAVREPAKEGRANRAIEEALAEYLGVPKSRVKIIAGQTAKNKIAEIF